MNLTIDILEDAIADIYSEDFIYVGEKIDAKVKVELEVIDVVLDSTSDTYGDYFDGYAIVKHEDQYFKVTGSNSGTWSWGDNFQLKSVEEVEPVATTTIVYRPKEK